VALGDFVVEDGTGVEDATSYVTVEEATNYCHTHQQYQAVWGAMSNEARQAALMYATRWIDDHFEFLGRVFRLGLSQSEPAQALRWPRLDIWDRDGRYLVSFDSGSDTCQIPDRVKEATVEAALMHVASAVNAFDASGQASQGPISQIEVDVIQIAFSNSPSSGSSIRNPDKAGSRVRHITSILDGFITRRGVYR
jgi:hypothetical protein